MLHFVKEIIIPYVTATRECLGRSQNQKALAIFDIFTAHRFASLKELLTETKSCSSMSLPVVHQSCSPRTSLSMIPIRRNSNNALQVKKVLDKGEEVHISLQTSTIKELHANWIIKTHSEMGKRKDTITSRFEQTGILEYIQ